MFTYPGNKLKGTRKLPLTQCLPPNAMMLYCSDFMKSTGELVDLQALKRGIQRYDFVPIIIQDEFESSFPIFNQGTFMAFSNPETGEREDAWISTSEAKKIKKIHESRFQELTDTLGVPGSRSIHLNNPDINFSIKKVDSFFRKRTSRSG